MGRTDAAPSRAPTGAAAYQRIAGGSPKALNGGRAPFRPPARMASADLKEPNSVALSFAELLMKAVSEFDRKRPQDSTKLDSLIGLAANG